MAGVAVRAVLLLALLSQVLVAGETLPAGALARMGSSKVGQEGAGHGQALTHLTFTPDGRQLITSGKDGSVRLWEAGTGNPLGRLATLDEHVVHVAVAPDGKAAAIAGASGALQIVTLAKENKKVADFKGPPLSVLAWTVDGKTLVAAGRGGQVTRWSAGKQIDYALYKGQDKESTFMTVSPDGTLLAASQHGNFPGVASGAVQVRSAENGRLIREIDLAELSVSGDLSPQIICWSAAFSPDGQYLATGQSLRTMSGVRAHFSRHRLRMWEIATGKEVFSLDNLRVGPSLLIFSSDGRYLSYATAEGLSKFGRTWGEQYFNVVDTIRIAEIGQIQPDMGTLGWLAFSPNGESLATSGTDRTAVIWDLSRFHKSARALPPATAGPAQPDLAALWTEVSQDDATKAYRALAQLIAQGDGAVVFLKDRLQPVPVIEAASIRTWIEELDSEVFAVRQKATVKLEKAGVFAESLLRKAQSGQVSPEFRRRLDLLLQKIERAAPATQEVHARRGLVALTRIGSPAARAAVARLAEGAPDARLTQQARAALERWPSVENK